MNRFKKVVSVIMAAAIVFCICAAYSDAATSKISGIKILSIPDKTEFYKGDDWIYGLWDSDNSGEITLVESSKISFTHNPCRGMYPERGMLDMSGLVIEVSYLDGSTEKMEYKEYYNSSGFLVSNILVAPKGGKEYFIGTNTMEVYLSAAPKYYDSYDIEIIDTVSEQKLTSDTAVIDYDKMYVSGLGTNLTLKQLQNDYFDFGDAEVSFTKAHRTDKFYGTGSTITLTYPDGQEQVYTIIIYGDADGNGQINFKDVSIVSKAVEDAGILTEIQEKAVNLDGRRRITATDLAILIKVASGAELDQKSFS